jgi:hypothetical protein
MDELAMELRDEIRVLQDNLGHVGPGLQVPAPLELEEVSLGANHRPNGEPIEQTPAVRRSTVTHVQPSSANHGIAAIDV